MTNSISSGNNSFSVWKALPVIVRAIISGVLVSAAVTLPWAWLVAQNIKHTPAVPWSILPTAILLWLFWQYFVKGKGWPSSTAGSRKKIARGNNLSSDVWAAAIIAGIAGLICLLAFSSVLGRMLPLPQQDATGVEHVPLLSLFIMVVGSSVVAGIAEETGFRGYMQQPIEERHGAWVAIIVTGLFFGLAHFSHAETTLSLLPFYFFVALIYGMLAHITNSILPGILLHAGGDIFAGLNLFAQGKSEWAPGVPKPLIWETGIDNSFMISVLGFVVTGIITYLLYKSLDKLVKREKNQTGD